MNKPMSVVDRQVIAQLLRTARSCPSDASAAIAEVGVYRGGTAWYLSLLARSRKQVLYLYDTFTGIPYQSVIDEHKVGDFGDTSVDRVRALVPYAEYRVGVFPSTFTEQNSKFSFVHVDCDQFQAVSDTILMFAGRMVRGGIMWFDDYGWLAGATRAVHVHFHHARLNPCIGGKVFVRF